MKASTLWTLSVRTLFLSALALTLTTGAASAEAPFQDLTSLDAVAATEMVDAPISEDAAPSEELNIEDPNAADLHYVNGPNPCDSNSCPDDGGGTGGGGYSCSVTVYCPSVQIGPYTTNAYYLSCSGYYSCVDLGGAVQCDGGAIDACFGGGGI